MPGTRSYTVSEANSALPWVRETITELRDVQRNIQISGLVMQRLAAHQRRRSGAVVGEDIRLAEQAISRGRRRVSELVYDMTERGIELRDLSYGLVDFPGMRDGQTVWLCWRMDEAEVGHWHSIDTGFANRQPL